MQKYAERPFAPPESRTGLTGYPELLQELLIARGITLEEEAERFLNPDYDAHVHDPFLMKDMGRAVDRTLSAIKNREHVTIYSDYDCDGIPGGVLLHDFFKLIGYDNFSNYIPHRHEEGYGLNVKAVEELAKRGAKLMITVDTGIVDTASIVRANELGIDVVVTDHHEPGEALPPAVAVLDHKRADETYPERVLCGTGVAFKLVQGVLSRNRFGVPRGKEKWLLDMVGLATIADMVPLIGENRVFARFGLTVLRKSPRPGLQKLCRLMKVNQGHLTEDDIGFMIAPRINAASRMDEPMEAFRLLSTQDDAEADVRAAHLNKINDQRKGVVASMVREIRKRIEARETREVIVVGDPRWRPALLGLVANTLVETYERPVFLWGREGGDVLKGSCRSDGSVDLVALMRTMGDVFVESGGHAFAGGFSVYHEKIHVLEERLVDAYNSAREENALEHALVVERRLSLDDVNWRTYKMLENLAPFGEGNQKPAFLFPDIEVKGARRFGREEAHLELLFANASGKKIAAISFFAARGKLTRTHRAGERVNLVATLEKSMFKNYPELRLRIVDIV
jgi:single-stranded-DNA-specific exonuclease